MRSAWTRWLAVVATSIGLAGCSSGKSWSMASLWPWGKSNSSASQTKLAQTTPGKPSLPSANAKASTLGTQQQLASAAGTGAPPWNANAGANSSVTPAGGIGAWPNPAAGAATAAAPGAAAPWAAGNPYGAAPAGYGQSPDPFGAVQGASAGQGFGATPYGAQPAAAQNYPATPGYGAGAGYGATPNYSAAGTQTGVTPGFEGAGAAYPQATTNPYVQQPAANAAFGPASYAAAPGAYGAAGTVPAGVPGYGAAAATSQYPTAQASTGAADYNVFGNTAAGLPSTPSYPSTDAGMGATAAAGQNYPSTAAATPFAPGSTRPADAAGMGAAPTQTANNYNLSAPPPSYPR